MSQFIWSNESTLQINKSLASRKHAAVFGPCITYYVIKEYNLEVPLPHAACYSCTVPLG